MGLLVLWLPCALAWPGDGDWLDLARAGVPLGDGVDPELPADLDVFAPGVAVGEWTADDEALWLRVRVAGPVLDASGDVSAGVRGVLVESDGDDAFDAVIHLGSDGAAWAVAWDGADPGTAPGFAGLGEPVPLGGLGVGARLTGVGGEVVELRVPREALDPLGLDVRDPLRLVPFAAPSLYLPLSDLAGCPGEPSTCPSIAAVAADAVYVDRDGDGLTDPIERRLGTSRTDADTDDDGVPDGDEPRQDTDGDGFPDARDCDADNDGIRDGLELGATTPGPGVDTNSVCWRVDADPGAVTDPWVPDTDGGGLLDGVEDWNRDGAVGPWETDPTDPADDLDSDGDGVADALELLGPDGSVVDDDSDGDGIPDAVERLHDGDLDGVPAFLDDDSDGDGIPDAVEGAADTDGDGTPDFRDGDSDGDGVSDAVEGAVDSDLDGLPDFRDLDSDDDGLRDSFESTHDFDGDGLPDRLDLDSDDDGLPDVEEGERDADGDGIRNAWESDSDGDGIPDAVEGPEDVDGDGTPNFEDRNADGTGASDASEGRGDIDCDGIPNWLDRDDEDGFCDPAQGVPAVGPRVEAPSGSAPAVGSGAWSGGCATGGGAAGWLLVGLALLAARRAGAQEVDAQRFRPAVDGRSFAGVEDLAFPERMALAAGVWAGRAWAPLAVRSGGAVTPVVDRLSTAHLQVCASGSRARIGVDLPVHLVEGAVEGAMVGGDVRLAGAVGLLRVGELRIGALGDLTLPTGARGSWVSAGRARARAGAALDGRLARWAFAGNAGLRTGTGSALGLLELGPSLFASAGAAWPAGAPAGLALELDGELGLRGGAGSAPAEWRGVGRLSPGSGWTLLAGGGTGLGSGVGAPAARVFVATTYRAEPRRFVEEFSEVDPP